jgi:hypothetical protein
MGKMWGWTVDQKMVAVQGTLRTYLTQRNVKLNTSHFFFILLQGDRKL